MTQIDKYFLIFSFMPRYILLISSSISLILSAIISVVPVWFYNQWQVSAIYPTLFTPAAYTFSIWSIIYFSWIILWVFVATKNIKIQKEPLYLLASAQILSSLWLIPSQFLFIGASLIVMWGVLFLLLLSFFISQSENKYFKYTQELFLSWILIASIANIHLTLVAYNIYFFAETLTLISLILAGYIFSLSILKYSLYIPSIVFVWSAIGIILWQENTHIQTPALILSIFIFGLLLLKDKKNLILLSQKYSRTKK